MTPPKWRALVDRVVADIDARTLSPGAKLPSLAELAEEGYSQGPGLQAYRWLVSHGYVETRHGLGTFVADQPPPPRSETPSPSNAELAAGHAELAAEVAQLRERLDAHLRRHQGDSAS